MNPICPYCFEESVFRKSSEEVYNGRDYGPVYVCWNYPQCDSYVGCHRGTKKPLGRMANKELREAKMAAHAAFDPIWLEKNITRHAAYTWLAKQLKISRGNCHIGMFDVEKCLRVVEVCKSKQAEEKEDRK